MSAKPHPGAPIMALHLGTDDPADFTALAQQLGVMIEEGGAWRPGRAVALIGPYRDPVTQPEVEVDAEGVATLVSAAVYGRGWRWIIGVDGGRIARMAAGGEDLAGTPAAALALFGSGELDSELVDGVMADFHAGVWLWREPPPGARALAGT